MQCAVSSTGTLLQPQRLHRGLPTGLLRVLLPKGALGEGWHGRVLLLHVCCLCYRAECGHQMPQHLGPCWANQLLLMMLMH